MVAQSKQTKLPLDFLVELYWYIKINVRATTQTSMRNNTSLNMPSNIVTMVAKMMTFRGTLFWYDLFTDYFSSFFYNKDSIEMYLHIA